MWGSSWLWPAPRHTWHPACQCTPLGHCFAHLQALHVPTGGPCAVGQHCGKCPKWHFEALSTMQCSGCCSTVWAPMATHPPSTSPVGANQRPWGAHWAPPPHTATQAPQLATVCIVSQPPTARPGRSALFCFSANAIWACIFDCPVWAVIFSGCLSDLGID